MKTDPDFDLKGFPQRSYLIFSILKVLVKLSAIVFLGYLYGKATAGRRRPRRAGCRPGPRPIVCLGHSGTSCRALIRISVYAHYFCLFRDFDEPDDIDVEDLPIWHPDKPKRGMDTTKLDGRDHVTTWSESNKGKQFGLYVTIKPGRSHSQNRIFESSSKWRIQK